MRTVLAISDSVENTQFDLGCTIATIKDLELDPLAVVPTFFRADNTSDSFDVTENIDYVFAECEFDAIKIGYLTNINVMNYLYEKLGKKRRNDLFLEPSLISDKGDILVGEDIYEAVVDRMASISHMIILNSFEAELLAEFECTSPDDYLKAAKKIFNSFGCLAFIKASSRTGDRAVFFDGFNASFVMPKVKKLGFDTNKYNVATAIIAYVVKGNAINLAIDYAMSFCAGIVPNSKSEVSYPSKEEVPQVQAEVKKTVEAPSFRVPQVTMSKTAVPSAENTSLVSPSKSIRDIARILDKDNVDASPAVTSTIEKPAPGPLGEVSDLAKPSLRLKNDVTNSLLELEALRNRLNSLTGSDNK